MLKILAKIKKIKHVIFKAKTIVVILVILAVIGWGFAIYFGLKARTIPSYTCSERLGKLHSYAVLLDKSTQLAREDKSFDVLEMDVRLLDNGSLLNQWENVVFGGNQKEDLDFYFDIVVDALKFFSK